MRKNNAGKRTDIENNTAPCEYCAIEVCLPDVFDNYHYLYNPDSAEGKTKAMCGACYNLQLSDDDPSEELPSIPLKTVLREYKELAKKFEHSRPIEAKQYQIAYERLHKAIAKTKK